MAWVIGLVAVCVTAVAALLAVRLVGPRVPAEQVAEEDLGLVRDADRARWRRQRLRAYRLDKRQDDYYRITAYRMAVAKGASEAEARVRVRKEFPFFYLNPEERDTEGFAGDDGGLPVVLRERVIRSAGVLKPLMDGESERFRTMNALVRTCIRKGAL